MTDLGNKVMESMFDAWCDDECKEFTPDHNDYRSCQNARDSRMAQTLILLIRRNGVPNGNISDGL